MIYASDGQWWRVYGDQARESGRILRSFRGELWAASGPGGVIDDDWKKVPADIHARARFIEVVKDGRGLSKRAGRLNSGGNSGSQAISMAYDWGARSAILLGYDMQCTGGKTHHHGDHAGGLPNLGLLDEWIDKMNQLAADLRREGFSVQNATRQTALTCFERVAPEAAFVDTPPRVSYHVQGMHGLGDNLHQRAVVRQLMRRGRVFLETPWPSVYHDLVGDRLVLINKSSPLRTQAKNASREAARYSHEQPPGNADVVRMSYAPEAVRRVGSVLAAMLETAKCEVARADFRLPIPAEWLSRVDKRIRAWRHKKPILVYRPLLDRTEWGGCKARNPDHGAYATLLRSIRERFFVVSVADVKPGVEWTVGEDIAADIELHAGELEFEALAALFHRAALVFASPGFAVPLAQAVGTPVVCVFGGYEDSRSFSAGGRMSPYLGIDPVNPCQCWSHNHGCDKRIDVPAALARLSVFAGNAISRVGAPRSATLRAERQPVLVNAAAAALPPFPPRFFNPGELDVLVHLVASVKPRTVIEFGCNEGRAASTILRNVPTIEEYVGIDVMPGYVTTRQCQRNEVPTEPGKYALSDPRFRVVLPPRGAFDLGARDLPSCDAVFIDADHSRAGVLNDYTLAKALVRPGGIIILHDDNRKPQVEVSETLDELYAMGEPIEHVDGTWIAFRKIEPA